LLSNVIFSQRIKNGTYIFKIRDLAYQGKIVGKCKVIIKADSITAIYVSGGLTGIKIGDIYAKGLLLKHKKTKEWIIGTKKEDVDAPDLDEENILMIDLQKKSIYQ
jgi:hypothetical protein